MSSCGFCAHVVCVCMCVCWCQGGDQETREIRGTIKLLKAFQRKWGTGCWTDERADRREAVWRLIELNLVMFLSLHGGADMTSITSNCDTCQAALVIWKQDTKTCCFMAFKKKCLFRQLILSINLVQKYWMKQHGNGEPALSKGKRSQWNWRITRL